MDSYDEITTKIDNMRCFERRYPQEPILKGFTAATILLDTQASWDISLAQAEKDKNAGYKLVFDIAISPEEDLFSEERLAWNRARFERFFEEVLVSFEDATQGLIVTKTPLDPTFQWTPQAKNALNEWLKENNVDTAEVLSSKKDRDFVRNPICCLRASEEGQMLLSLFCLDVLFDYLSLMLQGIQETLPCFACLDASKASPLAFARSTSRAQNYSYIIASKNAPFMGSMPVWDSGQGAFGYIGRKLESIASSFSPPLGIILPESAYLTPTISSSLEETMHWLMQKEIPFRAVSEEFLTTQWDGLDTLITPGQAISENGLRKLMGFCAAAGQVVTLGTPLGLLDETTFTAYKINHA